MNKHVAGFMTRFSTTIKCDFFPLCSGCDRQENVHLPPIWEEIQTFFGKETPLIYKETTGWRTRAKLAVRGTRLKPEMGLFKKGTHEVISIPTCPLHHPSINTAYEKVLRKMSEAKIEPYKEEASRGLIRYVQFAVERKSRRVQLTLVVNRAARDGELEKFVKQLYNEGGFHSIWLNYQPAQTNRIFGEQWELCEGEPYLWEQIGHVNCCFHPACFAQAHLSLFEEMLISIQKNALPAKHVLDLYSGIGVIGLNLVSISEQVHCVEINPYAEECFKLSQMQLPMQDQKKISFQTLPAEQAHLTGFEVIIVDPPRKGIDNELLTSIGKSDAEQLIYVSCGPHSLLRDIEKLKNMGWKVDKVEGYLFFPGSNHIEMLCILSRN